MLLHSMALQRAGTRAQAYGHSDERNTKQVSLESPVVRNLARSAAALSFERGRIVRVSSFQCHDF